MVNAGIPGEISEEGLERLPEVLKREKPALLILCHGANDLLRFLDKRQAAANLRAMIRLAREKGAAVVLIAVPSLDITLSSEPLDLEIATEKGADRPHRGAVAGHRPVTGTPLPGDRLWKWGFPSKRRP